MNTRILALAVLAAMLIAPLSLLAPAAAAPALQPKAAPVTTPGFEVLTNTTTPGGTIVFILSIDWLRNVQTITDPYVYIYIEEPISRERIPLISEDTSAIYNKTEGGAAPPGGIGAIAVGGVGQDYVIVEAQLPKMDWWYSTGKASIFFNKELYLVVKGRNSGEEAYSTTSFYISVGAKNLTPTLSLANSELSYTGGSLLGKSTYSTVNFSLYLFDEQAGAPFNYTDFVTSLHAVDPAATAYLNMEAAWGDTCGNYFVLGSISVVNQTVVSNATDVLAGGTGSLSFNPNTSTLSGVDHIANFSLTPCLSEAQGDAQLSYAQLAQSVEATLGYYSLINASGAGRVFMLNATIDNLTVNISDTSRSINYNITLSDYSVVGYGEIGSSPVGNTLILEYYSTADTDPGIGTTGTDYLYNITAEARYNDVSFKLNDPSISPANVEIYPAVIHFQQTDYAGGFSTAYGFSTADVYNVYDGINVTAYHLPAGATIGEVYLYYVLPGDPYTLHYLGELSVVGGPVTVNSDGTVTFLVNLTELPYDARSYYIIPKVEMGTSEYFPWPANASVTIYPLILNVSLIQPDGTFATDYEGGIGDYAIINVVGVSEGAVDALYFQYNATHAIELSVINASGTLLEKYNSTTYTYTAMVRIPYDIPTDFLDTVTTSFIGVFKAHIAVTDTNVTSANVEVYIDGSEAKIFYRAAPMGAGPCERLVYVSWNGITTTPPAVPFNEKYPYAAYEAIVNNKPEETEAAFFVEIIGAPYEALSTGEALVSLNVSGGKNYTLSVAPGSTDILYAIVGDYTAQGYFAGLLKVPTAHYGDYNITLVYNGNQIAVSVVRGTNEPNLVKVRPIIAVVVDKIFPKELTRPTADPTGDILAVPETIVNVTGWGFGESDSITLYIDVFDTTITTVTASEDGVFNASFNVKTAILDPLAVNKGIFTIVVDDTGIGVQKRFTISVQEVPVLKVKVASDPNVFPAEIGSIAIRAYLQYSTRQVPLDLTGGQPVMAFKEMEVYIYYYDGSVVKEEIKITPDLVSGATYDSGTGLYEFTVDGVPAYYNNETGLLMLFYTFDNVGGSATIDVKVTANYAGTGQNVSAFDHSVTSIEGYLDGVLTSINNTVISANNTIVGVIETAKGEILVNLTALAGLVQEGFNNVTMLIKDNATQILGAIATLQSVVKANATQILQAIGYLENLVEEGFANVSEQINSSKIEVITQLLAAIGNLEDELNMSAGDILAAIQQHNATVLAALEDLQGMLEGQISGNVSQVLAAIAALESQVNANATQILGAISSAYSELEGKIESVNATVLAEAAALQLYLAQNATYLEGVITSTGNLVINTVVGEIEIAKGEVETLLSNSTGIILQAVAGTGAQVIATLEGDIASARDVVLTVLGDQINASKEAVLAAVDNAASEIEMAINLTKAEIEVYVNSTVYNASEYVLAEVYAYLFGGSGSLGFRIGQANVSIAQIISQAKAAIVQTVQTTGNDVKGSIEAYVGDAKIEIIGNLAQAAENVSSNVTSAINAATASVEEEIMSSSDNITAAINASTSQLSDSISGVSSAVAQLSQKIDKLSSDLSKTASDLSSKIDNVQSSLSKKVDEANSTGKTASNYALAATAMATIATILAGIGVYFARSGGFAGGPA
ncbi:MAG: apolipoprotein A1/A4/E family protein [Desulfurococcales archaeon]|nr:apolipoprotein A1/A4/E family protein [Desulfurococcales archaeon]